MTRAHSGWSWRRAVVLPVVLGVAAVCAAPALAADAVPVPAVDVLPELEQLAPAILEDAGLPPLEAALPVATPISLPAVPAQKAAAEPVTAGAGAAPPPEPVAVPPVSTPALEQPQPDAPPRTVEQTAPANVNVSVRVDSPGNDGAVEQANVATTTGGGPGQPQYQEPPPQYQQPEPLPAEPETAADADAPPAEASSWEWTWSWDCGATAPAVPAPPAGAPQIWTWNWTWNCGDDEPEPEQLSSNSSARYQPDVTQYRPVNINISIRMNSPGDNGPVQQANLALAVAAPALAPLRVEMPAPAAGPAVSATAAVAALVLEPTQGVAAAELGVAVVVEGAETAEGATESDDCCAERPPRGVPDAERERPGPDAPTQRRTLIAPERFEPAVVATARLAEAATAAARRARAARAPARTVRPLPSRRPGDPSRDPAVVQRSAGFAPLTAQDGRLGRLVLLLAVFGFAIAFADAPRSVAAEVRATGEDPDPPPDRPG